ncbi:hypothetical protein V8G54_008283 [Vigna mungo]|uniref:Cytosolic purine 5'-nucleotidase n=1 Tax=Vigna mungo TaxID=3915 RepID=A0AAQ3P4X9_VIGMU
MVDMLDDGVIPANLGPFDYKGLYKAMGMALLTAHLEGHLKNEIMSNPEQFVELDPELPFTLLDQKEAGKKLVLITNSDYHYTDKMMHYSFNRFLPSDMGWRDLFDIIVVSANKPEFFQMSHPMYELVTDEGLMRPCFKAQIGSLLTTIATTDMVVGNSQVRSKDGDIPFGSDLRGSAKMVESSLNIHGNDILYIGDHIYTDVNQSKVHLQWRTALICRELEEEYHALIHSRGYRQSLLELINQKEVVGDIFNRLQLTLQRRSKRLNAQTVAATDMDNENLSQSMQKLLVVMQILDGKIAPMLEADGALFNKSLWHSHHHHLNYFLFLVCFGGTWFLGQGYCWKLVQCLPEFLGYK